MLSFGRYLRQHKKILFLSIVLSVTFVYLLSHFDRSRKQFAIDSGYSKAIAAGYQRSVELRISNESRLNIPSEAELRVRWIKEKVERMSKKMKEPINEKLSQMQGSLSVPNYNAHVFYYAWYKSLEVDGQWKHWNHEYLPNWMKQSDKSYLIEGHKPPDDIGSNFYPELGPYSSRNLTVIDIHMSQMRDSGLGVVVVSWYPPEFPDSPDDIFLTLLDAARKYQLKLAPHIEPYMHRNPINFQQYIKYFINKFGSHPSLYKVSRNGELLPVYYVYDSYLTSSALWSELLTRNGNLSVRGTQYDGVFLGLLVDMKHRYDIKKANFDGFYTYFATNGFTYGSSWKNWKGLSKFGRQSGLMFVPCVGPGYSDTAVRSWNIASSRHRLHGNYYEAGWRAALSVRPAMVAVTSFNEWHEGTQIEPAVPKKRASFSYLDYSPNQPDFYLKLTEWWVKQFTSLSHT